MLPPSQKKRRAAQAAIPYIEEGMVLGMGTGSTVAELIEELKDRKIRLAGAVSSSNRTTLALQAASIPVLDLNAQGDLALYIDGADEADEHGVLIKGGGGCHTRSVTSPRRTTSPARRITHGIRAAAACCLNACVTTRPGTLTPSQISRG